MSDSSTLAPSILSEDGGRPVSVGGKSFRESTHLIPTPGVEAPRAKRFEPPMLQSWLAVSLAILTITLGVAIEVVLFISEKNNGFSVPQKNIFSFVSTDFLTSFFPTLLIIPFSFLWSVNDWFVRWYQPYVTLAEGNAPADHSLLLDYIALNKLFAAVVSYKQKHWLVFVSSVIALVTVLLQPLAGSMLQITSLSSFADTEALNQQTLGLSPDLPSLNAFISSAGFAQAAVFNQLPDPPFVWEEWTIASFVPIPADKNQVNGTLTVNTTGIQTNVNCENPSSSHLSCSSSRNCTILSVSLLGCQSVVPFDPTISEQQYGVDGVPDCSSGGIPTSIGGIAPTNVTFEPVMFWFYDQSANITAGVFCAPEIVVQNVTATIDMTTNAVTTVIPNSVYTPPNNVTGSPLDGLAFNGVVFEPTNDPFVAARASATTSEVPGAIFRFASQQSVGLLATFDNATGFQDLTTQVYQQYLALTAHSIYFVQLPEEQSIPAKMESLAPRLKLEALSAHFLAIIMLLIGIVGLVVHILHKRARRNVYLTAPPGSIAAIVSLTARSGFGELLLPYDDAPTIAKKLDGLRFRLDRRTGAILAEGEDELGWAFGQRRKLRKSGRSSNSSVEESKMSLLTPEGRNRSGRPPPTRSSTTSARSDLLPGVEELDFEPLHSPYDPPR